MSYAAATASQDRLVTTMFVAALVHGLIIMGVSFTGFLPQRSDASPSLEVVLVQSTNQTDVKPDDAHYAAERNMSGSGTTTEQVRAQSRIATARLTNNDGSEEGSAVAEQLREAAPNSVSLVAARASSKFSVAALREENDEAHESTERARLMRAETAADELVSELDDTTQLHSPDIKELFVSVNTRESKVARYLALWKKKIEQVGTLNFPSDEMLNGLTGNPTLEVAIRSDGALTDVRVRRSSNHARLDQSAMRIVRLASPFDPFPPDVGREYDVMRFVYVWQFVDGQRSAGAVHVAGSLP